MTERVRGCHHCIGAGFTVAGLAFQFLHGKALQKGVLSGTDIAELQSQFLASFTAGRKLFEEIHHGCMDASGCSDAGPFSRDKILCSLLSACGRRAAQLAFGSEISACGAAWIDDFFCALAQYVRANVRFKVEPLLLDAHVAAAGKHKSNLTLTKLLQEEKVREAIMACISTLSNSVGTSERADAISTFVNEHLADVWYHKGARLAKTTKAEVLHFLEVLPNEGVSVVKSAAA